MKKLLLISLFILLNFNCLKAAGGDNASLIYDFIKVWGLLKYNSPVVSKGSVNWDARFISGYRQIENHIPADSFYVLLKNDIIKYSPQKYQSQNAALNLNFMDLDSGSKARLSLLATDTRAKGNFYFTRRPTGDPHFRNEIKYPYDSINSAAYRMLLIARVWNIINFLYPFKEELLKGWDETLKQTIIKTTAIKNGKEFELVLSQLMAALGDGHAYEYGGQQGFLGDKFWPSIQLDDVDNAIVVTEVSDSSLHGMVQVGDVVSKVDNMGLDSLMKKYSGCVSNIHQRYIKY